MNSENTHIYSKAELEAIYGDLLTDEQYDILDLGKAVFAVTLRGPIEGGGTLSAERYIVIEPALMDRWLRVTIPAATMDFFTGEVWIKSDPPEGEDFANTPVHDIHIVGETLGTRTVPTSYGDVIRNLVDGGVGEDADWADMGIPETFKEMSITIKKMEIVWE